MHVDSHVFRMLLGRWNLKIPLYIIRSLAWNVTYALYVISPKTRFGVKLTKKELLHLVTYKSTEIKEFVDELRSLIRKHKEAEQKKEK